MELKDKIELLKTEYFKLEDFYESYDSKIQTIKGWSVTISIAAITIGFSSKIEFIWLLASVTALIFWILEAKWKAFQYFHGWRIKEIEIAFEKNDFDNIVPLQIYTSFGKNSRTHLKTTSIMAQHWVMIPYLYTILLCLILFVLQYFSIVQFWKS